MMASPIPSTDKSPPEDSNTLSPVHQEGVPTCMISQKGEDGFGHQLEGKLSCMAVAADLGIKYIHTPFKDIEHGEAGSSMNEYMGLDKVFPILASIPNATERPRQPLPWVGKCNDPSWLRDLASGKRQCAHDGVSVYTADNCWDYFYCDGNWPDQWYTVQTRVRTAFLNSAKAYSVDMENNGPTAKRVVIHIRQGDGKKIPHQYFHDVIDMLKEEFEINGENATFHIETDGYKNDFQSFEDKGVIVEDRTTSLKVAFRRMVTADVFVASTSGLSDSAALLSLGQVIWPGCENERRTLPNFRVQPCNNTLGRMIQGVSQNKSHKATMH